MTDVQAEISKALVPLTDEVERIRALQQASIAIGGIAESMDYLMESLPDEAWEISHDPEADWKVCTIVIDWRLVPDDLVGLPSRRTLRLVGEGDDA